MQKMSQFTRACCGLVLALVATAALAAKDKPNILVVWGDDIGQSNISASRIYRPTLTA